MLEIMVVYELGESLAIKWIFFFKQKTAYEERISDWSSDVCSSDLGRGHPASDSSMFRKARSKGALCMTSEESRTKAISSSMIRSEERRVGKEWVSTCRSW